MLRDFETSLGQILDLMILLEVCLHFSYTRNTTREINFSLKLALTSSKSNSNVNSKYFYFIFKSNLTFSHSETSWFFPFLVIQFLAILFRIKVKSTGTLIKRRKKELFFFYASSIEKHRMNNKSNENVKFFKFIEIRNNKKIFGLFTEWNSICDISSLNIKLIAFNFVVVAS